MKARTPWLIVAVFLALFAVSGAAYKTISDGSFTHDGAALAAPAGTAPLEHCSDAGCSTSFPGALTLSEVTGQAKGGEVTSRTWALKPFEPKLMSLPDLGVSSREGGFVVFTRTSSLGSFVAYSSVVDQHTGDSILIVAH